MSSVRRVRLRGSAIEKRYGRVAALRGVDLEIAPGESVAVLGANGAGKSSLLRILAGLSRPSAGSFFGRIERDATLPNTSSPETGSRHAETAATEPLSREALRGTVGYVGHATLLYGELSARENLSFAARLHGQRPTRDQLDAILDSFSLLDVADRRAGTFSRGMAQRLSIARAIAHGPSVLLLDEPFTGLDEVSAEGLSDRLSQQREQGRTLVLVTHDPRRATQLSERAVILHRGEVRATSDRHHADGRASSANSVSFEVEALREALARLAREGIAGVPRPQDRVA